MPPRYSRVPEITQAPRDLPELQARMNTAIRVVNEVLEEIALADSQLRGRDGFTPQFEADVDLGGQRLRNISRSQRGGDAVTRRELEEIGILGNPNGVVFNRSVTFAAGATSNVSALGGGEIPTTDGILELVNTVVAGAIPVAVAGDSVTTQSYGRLGTTQGSLILGRNGSGRAEFAEIRNGHVLIASDQIVGLLTLILEQLERLGHGPTYHRGIDRARGRRYNAQRYESDVD